MNGQTVYYFEKKANYKYQITNKSQKPISKTQTYGRINVYSLEFAFFIIWNLFGFWFIVI